MPSLLISNGNVVLEKTILKRCCVLIEQSKIFCIGKVPRTYNRVCQIDARGLYLSPGFIDTHIHGGPGDIILNETKYGTTAFVIAVSCGRPVPEISEYPNILGVRLEGPYINPLMAGAQNKRFIKPPSESGLLRIIKDCGRELKMMTLAPELPGSKRLISLCRKHGVIPSISHSDATYDEAKKSFAAGIRHATHLFNAMSGPRHGTAGAALAALFDRRVTVEVIADLKHVSRELLRLVFAVKDKSKIVLITDSIRAEKTILSTPGVDNGLVGAGHMIDCVKNAVRYCGLPLTDAVGMASVNPARLLGADKHKGSIAPGKDADLVAFDKDFNVKFTVVGGRMVYQKRGTAIQCAG